MLVSAIVAVAKNNVIGKDNQIPWYLPADLAWFKRCTLGHAVIMGRKCFRSIGRPLPKRTNIVITRDPFFVADGVVIVNSIEAALDYAFDAGETEAFIIGGGEIYRQSVEFWDKIYLTEVDLETKGDVFFPETDPTAWRETFREAHEPDAKNEWPFVFRILEKIEV
ncbi:MAG: type 3 dihydrofolate reductase [Saprospiraceae bacterium]